MMQTYMLIDGAVINAWYWKCNYLKLVSEKQLLPWRFSCDAQFHNSNSKPSLNYVSYKLTAQYVTTQALRLQFMQLGVM